VSLAISAHSAISQCWKPSEYIDLSGWSPKYFSPALVQYANTLLKNKVLFGSDYPLINRNVALGRRTRPRRRVKRSKILATSRCRRPLQNECVGSTVLSGVDSRTPLRCRMTYVLQIVALLRDAAVIVLAALAVTLYKQVIMVKDAEIGLLRSRIEHLQATSARRPKRKNVRNAGPFRRQSGWTRRGSQASIGRK
jgi:hypothetical protein